jgi:Tol biopolymer transport system component/tRNA A-37 threonylcarbamoyl transferase component Bud32
MAEPDREPAGVLRQALDALADATAVDWATLASGAGDDPEARQTLEALRQIASIAQAHAPVAAATLPPPFRWGALEVHSLLARGAHGDVYRARDPRLDRDVALKLLRHDENDAAAPTAITEGRLLARVRHPNVVAVYGADRLDGQAGIWMELVEGQTLHERLAAHGPRPEAEVVETGAAVCAGLAAIHAAGLVHRDVKAQNVVRDRAGRTVLMDLSAGEEDAEPRARLEGTPLYLAPELLEGGRATVLSDVYAVGVLLHVLATGVYPVAGETIDELRAVHRSPRRSSVARDRVPADLARVIERAIAPWPADRFASASAMQEALALLAKRRPARRVAAALALGACLALAIVGGLAMVAGDRASTPLTLSPGSAKEPRVVPLPPYVLGPLSADGRFVPYVDRQGNIFRYEIATGQARMMARASDATGRPNEVLLSRDTSRIAYAWHRPDGGWELRKSRADGGTRVVMPPQWASVPTPLDWSSDDQSLLCALRQQGGAIDVVLVTDELGTPPRLLFTVPAGGDVSGAVSDDGRFAAIAIHADTAADGLHLLDIAARTARRVHDGPVRLPRFAAGDRQLFFIRREQAMDELWTVPLQDGAPTGAAALVVAELGGVFDMRVTAEGVLHRVSSVPSAEVYTARFDVLGNAPPGTPTRIDPAEIGNHVGPAWSPDGRHLAYFTIRQTVPGLTPARTLTLRDMTTGQVRRLSVPLVFLGGYTPRWSPDGRHVAVWGRDQESAAAWGYYRVDVASGETAPLVRMGINAPAYAQFMPDGRAFCYTDPRRGIISRDLASGQENVLVPVDAKSRPGRFAISPDGDALAFVRLAGPADTSGTTIEVQRRGQRPAVRVQASWPDWVGLHAWTPDGTHILYGRSRGDDLGSLWRIGADGGTPVDLRFRTFGGPNAISVHPDGPRLAWAERVLSPELRISRLPER